MHIIDNVNALQVCSGYLQPVGYGACCQQKLVVREFIYFARIELFHSDRFGLAVNSQGSGPGQHGDTLGIMKKSFVTHHMKTGGAQFLFIRNISGDKVWNTTAAIGNKTVLVNDNNFGIRLQPLYPAGSFGACRDTADYNNFFRHNSLVLLLFALNNFLKKWPNNSYKKISR